jgi:glucoamylase
LRITKDGNPNAGTTYNIGDSGPNGIDQRRVVDTSYLELVRLGVKSANDPNIVQTLSVVDSTEMLDNQKVGLMVDTDNGTFWHRFNFDGYGETREGEPWDIGFTPCDITTCLETQNTIGRAWPIFAGERGEYELAAGQAGAAERLASIAKTGDNGYMLPEQVWDDFPPSGQPGFPSGEGTFSATPLAWTHAQFVRLAWSIEAGRPIERPPSSSNATAEMCLKPVLDALGPEEESDQVYLPDLRAGVVTPRPCCGDAPPPVPPVWRREFQRVIRASLMAWHARCLNGVGCSGKARAVGER